jgi:hypothetical protein
MGWAWSGLPGRLGQEFAAGIYSGLTRQILILLPLAVLLFLRWKRQKATAPVV